MDFPTLFFASFGPSFVLAYFFWVKDKYDKEPIRLLLIAFVLGAISVIPAAFLESLAQKENWIKNDSLWKVGFFAFGVVGLSEELSKFVFLRLFLYKNKNFNEPYDGIIYAVMISLGFASIENLLYVYNGGLGVALTRAFTAVPAHAVFAVMMGYYAGLAKFSRKKNKSWLLFSGLIIAIFFHGLYDFFLFSNKTLELAFMALVVLGLGIFFSFRAIKINQRFARFRKKPLWKS